MLDIDELVLDPEVGGSLQEALVLRGTIGDRSVLVLFSTEILEHWPADIQAARINEMLPFVEGAIRRALADRRYSVVGNTITGRGMGYLIVLGWMDIAS
ncbi:hypothetical protein [Sphingomonas radiodurans]|uniref:hypothetical protein n=1 Tax=Sphingomonas radiodurans TaxID=2890321 RepID=UPI001E59A35D|nr:hypothetical protein [Sphingomonas radiodurans]WBH15497.1 hypothetical protein LLW23_11715 [Sphingomonas radiodurans]